MSVTDAFKLLFEGKLPQFCEGGEYDIFIQAYETIAAVREGINKFIEHYNYKRPHQALNYKTPSQLYFSQ